MGCSPGCPPEEHPRRTTPTRCRPLPTRSRPRSEPRSFDQAVCAGQHNQPLTSSPPWVVRSRGILPAAEGARTTDKPSAADLHEPLIMVDYTQPSGQVTPAKSFMSGSRGTFTRLRRPAVRLNRRGAARGDSHRPQVGISWNRAKQNRATQSRATRNRSRIKAIAHLGPLDDGSRSHVLLPAAEPRVGTRAGQITGPNLAALSGLSAMITHPKRNLIDVF